MELPILHVLEFPLVYVSDNCSFDTLMRCTFALWQSILQVALHGYDTRDTNGWYDLNDILHIVCSVVYLA